MSWHTCFLRYDTEAAAKEALFVTGPEGPEPRFPVTDVSLAPMPVPMMLDSGKTDPEGYPLLEPIPGYHVNLRIRDAAVDPAVFGAALIEVPQDAQPTLWAD